MDSYLCSALHLHYQIPEQLELVALMVDSHCYDFLLMVDKMVGRVMMMMMMMMMSVEMMMKIVVLIVLFLLLLLILTLDFVCEGKHYKP
jgi:hypothetical protein